MRAIVVLMALLLSGAASSRMQIVTTTAMIADVARAVAGELAQVRSMMGPGTDPHLYQATPSDIRALQGADLILYNGLLLEGQLGEVLGRFGELKPVIKVVEASMPADRILANSGLAEGSADPHVWMDASLFSLVAPGVADALAGLDAGNAAVYRANADAYVAQLEALHEWIAHSIASIPEEHRILVTAHDAFGYYGAAYGIEVAGIQGLSTETEAAVADIRETVDLVVELSVPTIFVESTKLGRAHV